MSYSSLYLIDKEYKGENVADFHNSWWFSPIVWDVLSEKYLPKFMGQIQRIIGFRGNEVHKQINHIMNNSDNTCERICWELSNQQIFFSKDKDLVADSIMEFVETHKQYYVSDEDNLSVFQREHIIERFTEIADTIRSINENENPCFVFKNTSVDDGVENWFSAYKEETDEYEDIGLDYHKNHIAEFVVIENGKVKNFVSNLYFDFAKGEIC